MRTKKKEEQILEQKQAVSCFYIFHVSDNQSLIKVLRERNVVEVGAILFRPSGESRQDVVEVGEGRDEAEQQEGGEAGDAE